MGKFILLLFFLLIFNLSHQISNEDLDKYYKYAVNIFEGMSKTGNETCANILKEDKEHYINVIKKILYEMEMQNHTIPIAFSTVYLIYYF